MALSAQLASVARATRHEEVVAPSSRRSGLASGPGDAPGHRHSLQPRYDTRPAPPQPATSHPRPTPPRPVPPQLTSHSALVLLNVPRGRSDAHETPAGTPPPSRPRCGDVRGGRVMMWWIIDYHAIHSSSHPPSLPYAERPVAPPGGTTTGEGGRRLPCVRPCECGVRRPLCLAGRSSDFN